MDRDTVERAGLRYPPGNPDDFTTAAHQLARVSAELQAVPGRVQQLARLGEAWTGTAAEWFRAGAARSMSGIADVSGALRLAALAADAAGAALRRQQQAARRLAEQVNEAEQEYRQADREADRAEEHAQQARDRAMQATIGAPFSLAEQAHAAREAEAATQQASQARERATRARERYEETKQHADRKLRQLEEDTERADTRARSMFDEVSRTLAAFTEADPADGTCPIDNPLFTTGAGLLPWLTHGTQLARNALSDPLGPLAGSARGNAYNSLAGGLREIFPGACIGPEPPTPPSDPPSPRPEPVRPEPVDERNPFERALDTVTGAVGDAAGSVKTVVEDAPGALEDVYHAYDRWTDQAVEDTGNWVEDVFSAPPDQPLGPFPMPPIPRPGPG